MKYGITILEGKPFWLDRNDVDYTTAFVPATDDELSEHIIVLTAISNAKKLRVEVTKLVQYCGYICKTLNEHNTELLVLAYKDPYIKMVAWVGCTIDVGFENLHLVKDFPAPTTLFEKVPEVMENPGACPNGHGLPCSCIAFNCDDCGEHIFVGDVFVLEGNGDRLHEHEFFDRGEAYTQKHDDWCRFIATTDGSWVKP